MSINYCIHTLFPTSVMEFDLQHYFSDNEIKILHDLQQKAMPHYLIPNGFTTYSSIQNLLNLKKYTFLKHILDKCVEEYCKTVALQPLLITRCWSSFLSKGCKTNLHKHEGSVVSGALYIQSSDLSSPLILHSPLKPYRHFDLFYNENINNSYTTNLPAKTFILYIFPSWLEHETELETTKDTRQVISFNTSYKHLTNI